MNNGHPDWAWPALIQSLQSDISRLREAMDEARRETASARELHRRELDGLIEQLRDLRNEIAPVIRERHQARKHMDETRWAWIERLGWVVMGGIALAVWEFFKRHFQE